MADFLDPAPRFRGGKPPGDEKNEWRLLGPADLEAVYALHRAATDAVGRPDLIRPESRAFFATLLGGGGVLCGTFDIDGLKAYGVLQWDLPPAEDLRPLFGLPPDAPFAKLAGASVRPSCWGSGLHEAMIAHRLDMAAARGLTHLYATSAPGNARSWENLMNRGFAVRALAKLYGNHLRLIFYRSLAAPLPADLPGNWCDVADGVGQQRLITAGHIGVAWRRTADQGREIFWVMPIDR